MTLSLQQSFVPEYGTLTSVTYSSEGSSWRQVYSVADPGCLTRIPDPNFSHPGSRIRPSKNLSILTQKNWFLRSWKYDPDGSSRIRSLTFYPSRTTGSRIRIRNTVSVGAYLLNRGGHQQLSEIHWDCPITVHWPLGRPLWGDASWARCRSASAG